MHPINFYDSSFAASASILGKQKDGYEPVSAENDYVCERRYESTPFA